MFIDLHGRVLVTRLLVLRQLGDTRRRAVWKRRGGIERAHKRCHDIARRGANGVARRTRQRTIGTLEPGRTNKTKTRKRNARELTVWNLRCRHHRQSHRANATIVWRIHFFQRGPPVQPQLHPAHRIGTERASTGRRVDIATTHTRPVALVAEINSESLNLLLIRLCIAQIQTPIEIDVFFVEPIVAHTTVGATVAQNLLDIHRRRAERHLVLRGDAHATFGPVDHDDRVRNVAGQPFVIFGGVERA